MRNLDECKAEIFRLGDEKIKKRKKRRVNTLSVCVPLCLCLVALSATVLSTMLYENKMINDNKLTMGVPENDGHDNEDAVCVTTMQYARAEISVFGSASFSRQVNEKSEVNDIANLIKSYYKYSNGSLGGPDGDAEKTTLASPEKPESGGTENSDKPLYEKPPSFDAPELNQSLYLLISFTTDKGDKVEYIFSGSILSNETIGAIILTDAQKNELLSELIGGD